MIQMRIIRSQKRRRTLQRRGVLVWWNPEKHVYCWWRDSDIRCAVNMVPKKGDV